MAGRVGGWYPPALRRPWHSLAHGARVHLVCRGRHSPKPPTGRNAGFCESTHWRGEPRGRRAGWFHRSRRGALRNRAPASPRTTGTVGASECHGRGDEPAGPRLRKQSPRTHDAMADCIYPAGSTVAGYVITILRERRGRGVTRAWRARGRLRGGMLPGQVSPPVGCVGLRSCIGAGSTTPSPPFGGSRPRRTPALMHEIAKTQSTTSLLDCCYHSLPSHSCPSYWFCLGASAPRLPSGRLEDPQLVGACPPGVSRMCMLNPLGSAEALKNTHTHTHRATSSPCHTQGSYH